MSQQYLRKYSLTVSGNGLQIDLSELRFTFNVSQSDVETPNNMRVRIYNLSDKTANRIKLPEFDHVTLQAGYQNGPYGLIFDGEVIQYRKGRESQVDKYFDIIARDADEWLNFGTVSQTLAPGATWEDQYNAIMKSASASGITKGSLPLFTGPAFPRGKVLYGLARESLRDLSISNNARASINNGKLNIIPLSSYIPSQAVVLNSMTGLIGIPDQTIDGIRAKCLLRPDIEIGQPVKINNADIQSAEFSVAWGAINVYPSVSTDGLYRVLVVEHSGDTRGQEWYSDLTCLSIDPSASIDNAVPPYPSGG